MTHPGETSFSGRLLVKSSEAIKAVARQHPTILSPHVAARLTGKPCVSLIFIQEINNESHIFDRQFEFVLGQGEHFLSAAVALLTNLPAVYGLPPDRWPALFGCLRRLAGQAEGDLPLEEVSHTATAGRPGDIFHVYCFETKARP